MKGMLSNINELIRDAFQRTNGSVSWKTIASMVAGGVDKFNLHLRT